MQAQAKVVGWRRPFWFVFGTGDASQSLQWLVAVVAVSIFVWSTVNQAFQTAEAVAAIPLTRTMVMPTWLSRDFTLVDDLNTQIIVRPVDPSKTRLTLSDSEFSRVAASKKEHFVFPYRPDRGNWEVNYILQNPTDTYELHNRTLIPPTIDQGGVTYRVQKPEINRESWTMELTYKADQPVSFFYFWGGAILWVFVLGVYGVIVRPIHHWFAKALFYN